MAEKFDWLDVETLRSQAATKRKRAEAKRKAAKTAPPRKEKPSSNPAKPRQYYSPNDKPALLKGAERNEREAVSLEKRADKWASILQASEQKTVRT